MYFDFEDYRPDTPTVGSAISWREGILLSIIFHLVMVIALIVSPRIFPVDREAERARLEKLAEQQRERNNAQFVFVAPRLDTPAPKPPDRADLSDKDRVARAPRARTGSEERSAAGARQHARARRGGAGARGTRRRAAAGPGRRAAGAEHAAAARAAARFPVRIAVADADTAAAQCRRERPVRRGGRFARRRAQEPRALRPDVRQSRRAAVDSSALRFNSTPKASSSVRGSDGSWRRSSGTG